ncbi:MAG: 3-dehydroquinate synthase [Legionella sp.]|nr:3-dehydroquinate synthase [Legionella sp.]
MAKSDCFRELLVRMPAHDYPVLIGRNILTDRTILRRYATSRQVLIVTNVTVAPLYLHFLQDAFSDRQCDVVILKDGEEYKNQQSLFQIYDTLIEKNHHRDTLMIALGGGVVGDICGFAASTYQRGVEFLQIPTTLLAQVDASVGGKTAINHPEGKNMIGSFYQPKAVIIDTNTLNTLPQREFHAGVAEIIKYGILVGNDFLNYVEEALNTNMDSCLLPELIRKCCQIKATIVQQDERESGQRALLNLGHTVAHALEAYTHYSRWLHGEAVGIGLYCAALLSHLYYGLDKKSLERIDKLLLLANLPRRIPKDIDLTHLRELMNKDKKIKNNTLRFVLVKELGNCYLEEKVAETSLAAVLQCAVEGE